MKLPIDHIVLNVEDDETMISFYSEVLHLPTEHGKRVIVVYP